MIYWSMYKTDVTYPHVRQHTSKSSLDKLSKH